MTECRIPVHITGLYVFAVANLCAMLNISLVSSDIIVFDIDTNTTTTRLLDGQAMFGRDFPSDGLIVFNVESAGFLAAIVHNYEGDDSIMSMGGDLSYVSRVKIPSTFVGYTDGMLLAHTYSFNGTESPYVVKIIEMNNIDFTSYFWPFIVVLSVCFFLAILFSVAKFIQFVRHRRRGRLSLSALKKIPTHKFKNGGVFEEENHVTPTDGDYYDVCAICLEDYREGEKLRVLPCNHVYHSKCIDPWLTKMKQTCPQCKRSVLSHAKNDGIDSEDEDFGSANENTPLLSNVMTGDTTRRDTRLTVSCTGCPPPPSPSSRPDPMAPTEVNGDGCVTVVDVDREVLGAEGGACMPGGQAGASDNISSCLDMANYFDDECIETAAIVVDHPADHLVNAQMSASTPGSSTPIYGQHKSRRIIAKRKKRRDRHVT